MVTAGRGFATYMILIILKIKIMIMTIIRIKMICINNNNHIINKILGIKSKPERILSVDISSPTTLKKEKY